MSKMRYNAGYCKKLYRMVKNRTVCGFNCIGGLGPALYGVFFIQPEGVEI